VRSSKPLTGAKQTAPLAFCGGRASDLWPSLNGNSCESLTSPDPSARPPQEKRSTWLPGARLSSKLRHALVCKEANKYISKSLKEEKSITRLLTMRANPGLLLCFPAVIKSHFCPSLPSQGLIWIGVKFSLKSPEVGSTKRHCPSEV